MLPRKVYGKWCHKFDTLISWVNLLQCKWHKKPDPTYYALGRLHKNRCI